MSKKLTPIAATMLVALSSPLMAQPAQAPSPAASLPPMTVRDRSAQAEVKTEQSASVKHTAPLLDTPKSLKVIPATVIRQTGSTSLADALRTTPGITFADRKSVV